MSRILSLKFYIYSASLKTALLDNPLNNPFLVSLCIERILFNLHIFHLCQRLCQDFVGSQVHVFVCVFLF